jgi:hypothetical protein
MVNGENARLHAKRYKLTAASCKQIQVARRLFAFRPFSLVAFFYL